MSTPIERGAEAQYERRHGPGNWTAIAKEFPNTETEWLADTRAALAAALDRDEIATEIEHQTGASQYLAQNAADAVIAHLLGGESR